MTIQHNKSERWRPWQFSLRALLLLMLVVASYLGGWMSNEWKQHRELERAKQEAEEELRRAEAQVRTTQFSTGTIPAAGSYGVE